MAVSPLRDRIGRTVLGLFGIVGIAGGALAAFGIHTTGPRVLSVLGGLALISHSVGLLRIARKGEAALARDHDHVS